MLQKEVLTNFNGVLTPAGQPLLAAGSRAWRYGDGLFESIRVFGGRMPFFERHWRRLSAGMAALRFEPPPHFTQAFFEREISKLTGGEGNWRVRLTAWRSGGGLYEPQANSPEFLIEASPLPAGGGGFEWSGQGLAAGIFERALLHPNPLSCLKTCSALPFVLAAIFKKENRLEDCLLLNHRGRVACASSANVFWWEKGMLLTPPLSEGCVAGTMRAVVLDLANSLKIKTKERALHLHKLVGAEECFLTNAVQGIRPLRKVEDWWETAAPRFEKTKMLWEKLDELAG